MNRRLAVVSILAALAGGGLAAGAGFAAGASLAAADRSGAAAPDASAATAATVAATVAADRRAVEQAVLDYAEAFYLIEPERLERSVHRELVKLGFFRDGPAAAYDSDGMTFDELYALAGSWNRNGRFDRRTARREVVVLDMLDQTAAAKLVAEWGIDYLHLAKYDGRWQIIHVLWQTHPPAAAAASPS
jgi:hypothetical protein